MRNRTRAHGPTNQSERDLEKHIKVESREPVACCSGLMTIALTFALSISSPTRAQQCGCSNAETYTTGGTSGGYYTDGSAGQLFPYDQQDTWLHGQHQRVPSYAGYGSFRPYNYRHIAPQAQIASSWGATHGMTYSQQFFNKYRNSYLDENLQANATNNPPGFKTRSRQPQTGTQPLARRASIPRVLPNDEHATHLISPILQQRPNQPQRSVTTQSGPPIHVYPPSAVLLN